MPGMVTTMVSRRDFLQGISALSVSDLVRQGAEAEAISAKAPSEPPPQQLNGTPAHPEMECGNSLVRVRVSGSSSDFWSLERRASGQIYRFGCPIFPLGGKSVPATLKEVRAGGAVERLKNGVTECSFEGPLTAAPSLLLRMTFRIAPDNPVVRFRYSLANQGAEAVTFEKADGRLTYLSMSFADMSRVKEVRLSDFNSMLHSDTVSEFDIPQRWFAGELNVAGPILIGESQGHEALLLAYEHGSQMPDTFLRFDLQPDRVVKLVAVKGNYLSGQALKVFDSVWMEAAVCPAGAVASQFRTFVRKYLEAQGESRRPYLYYNTWNFQERNKWWNGKGYFTSYNEERMLQEIDIAHTMGLEIFVMVSGWHGKTGDWEVHRERFPDDLKAIKARLDQHGMKLGLWFNPTMAAVSSKILAAYRSCILSWKGKLAEPGDVWGSEVSYPMCLVSAYADAYADTVIRVARETGARYFVWDAVAQYGCDSPDHWHGTSANSEEERSNSYGFQLPLQLVRIVEKVKLAYPEIIFDFDITETGRAVGLSFLSAGRFFLINNGPYLVDYDLPHFSDTESDNIFFYPGTARTWICRRPLTYDEWIPSNLFLTHYLPDDPASSQLVNMASLILGQNGIWGDLPKVSEAGVQWIGEVMGRYKQVREDMAESDPIRTGEVAGVYEVHEKISNSSNRGAVVLFSATKGRIVYVTEHTPKQTFWATPGTKISFDGQGHAVLENDMESGAAIAFFGVG
jgi:alpha-galactosidase